MISSFYYWQLYCFR